MGIAIKVENLSKAYQLGEIGTGTLSNDLKRWAYKIRGKEDPFLKIGEANDRTTKGESDIVWSLKDINFEIEQGDAVGIIGRNGAGKSTLLKILSRVTSPTTGNIKVKGRVASLLEVGTGFHPELSGRDNIFLNGAILGMRKTEIKKHFDAIVDFAGIERYIDTPVKRYSSGMYVRLAFAVAAHLESEILVVDEVLAVGDAEFQKKCLGKMSDVSKEEGRTVLFVSHDLLAVNSLCQNAILLKNGRIEFSGITSDTIGKYLVSNSSFFDFDFKNLKKRSGEGNLQFHGFSFYNFKKEKLTYLTSGEDLILSMQIYNKGGKSVDTKVSFAITNNLGLQLTMMGNEFSNKEDLTLMSGYNTINCKIKRFPIVSGRYSLTLFCKNKEGIQDWIINELFFDVEKGNFYGSNRNLDNEQSLFLVDYMWEHEKKELKKYY